MKIKEFVFSDKKVHIYWDFSFAQLEQLTSRTNTVILTDHQVFKLYKDLFNNWKIIVIDVGEAAKQQSTINEVVRQLMEMGADKSTCLVGVGGGVVTDIAGFVASIYMRGIDFGFVPTTLLGMVDASIGGKNGIDVGDFKNMIGTTNQPSFLVYDFAFLNSLSEEDWSNGFAEIIKHACIKDQEMFNDLELSTIDHYRINIPALTALVEKNVHIKMQIVQSDEFETGERKLLNFGHTIGHAIERVCNLSHGKAISKGMVCAAMISEKISNLPESNSIRVVSLLRKYGLPTDIDIDVVSVMRNVNMDKKRKGNDISYILLDRIGKARIKAIPLDEFSQLCNQLSSFGID